MRFIVTGDWHFRSDLPRCRLDDDWLGTQAMQVRWIFEQAEKYDAMVIHTGDMFHRSVSSVGLVNWAVELLKPYADRFISIAGNHDLPNHAVEKLGGSAYGIIDKTFDFKKNTPDNMICFPFGMESPGYAFGMDIVVLHRLVVESDLENVPKSMWSTAASVLSEFPDAKWIFTGDNHGGFIYSNNNGQTLVNPGSLNRQTVDGMDYKPRAYFVDTDKLPGNANCTALFIPDDETMVYDSYLAEEKVRDERIVAFVEKVKDGYVAGLSFEDNVKRYISMNDNGDDSPKLSKRSIKIIEEICL